MKTIFNPGECYIIEPGITGIFVKETSRYLYFSGSDLYNAMFEVDKNGLFPFAKGHKKQILSLNKPAP